MNAMYYLKIKIPNTIYRIAQFLEILVSLLVIAAIILSFGTILSQLGVMASHPSDTEGLRSFLSTAFTVVIGIEFLKYLFIPGLDDKQTLTVPRTDEPLSREDEFSGSTRHE